MISMGAMTMADAVPTSLKLRRPGPGGGKVWRTAREGCPALIPKVTDDFITARELQDKCGLLAQWRSSGRSGQAFCRERGLVYAQWL